MPEARFARASYDGERIRRSFRLRAVTYDQAISAAFVFYAIYWLGRTTTLIEVVEGIVEGLTP